MNKNTFYFIKAAGDGGFAPLCRHGQGPKSMFRIQTIKQFYEEAARSQRNSTLERSGKQIEELTSARSSSTH